MYSHISSCCYKCCSSHFLLYFQQSCVSLQTAKTCFHVYQYPFYIFFFKHFRVHYKDIQKEHIHEHIQLLLLYNIYVKQYIHCIESYTVHFKFASNALQVSSHSPKTSSSYFLFHCIQTPCHHFYQLLLHYLTSNIYCLRIVYTLLRSVSLHFYTAESEISVI